MQDGDTPPNVSAGAAFRTLRQPRHSGGRSGTNFAILMVCWWCFWLESPVSAAIVTNVAVSSQSQLLIGEQRGETEESSLVSSSFQTILAVPRWKLLALGVFTFERSITC